MIKTACLLDRKGGTVAARYAETGYIVLVDAETYAILCEMPRGDMTDTDIARRLVEEDCEAVITGPMEKEPFEIIADEGMITRYNGVGLETMDAVKKMNAYVLKIIPDYEGGTGCSSGGECRDHSHDRH